MRIHLALAGMAAAALMAFPASAREGQYSAALSRMITESAAGTCTAELMAPSLLAVCEQQITNMAAGLASLGAIQSVTFVSARDTPQGRVETYAVVFAGGQTLNWFIGGFADGKFSALGTGGA